MNKRFGIALIETFVIILTSLSIGGIIITIIRTCGVEVTYNTSMNIMIMFTYLGSIGIIILNTKLSKRGAAK